MTVSALIALLLSTTNVEYNNNLSDFLSDSGSDTSSCISTTKLGLQQSNSIDSYMPGTIPERLYKHAQLVYNNYKEGFLLSIDDFVPTASEAAAVEAEVDNIVLTQAIETINRTARSGRHVKPTQKVKLNTEQELAFR
jgi:hypothetical protein